MPCRTYDDGELLSQEQQKVNQLTRMLCETFKFADSKHPWFIGHLSGEIQTWWKCHKIMDEDRKRREKFDTEYQKKLREWEKRKPQQ